MPAPRRAKGKFRALDLPRSAVLNVAAMKARLLFAALLTALTLPHGRAAEKDSAGAQEIARLSAEAEKENDFDKRRALYDRLIPLLREQWKTETVAKKKREYARELVQIAVQNEQPEVVFEIATEGRLEQDEIKIPEEAKRIPLRALQTLARAKSEEGEEPHWVARRITADRFEVWLPDHGWLFDGKGKLLQEAHPPRRDGTGREWYGAFLPDGNWVTTDLFAYDCVLTFFAPGDKWLKEVPSQKLVPPADSGDTERAIIGWCRADAAGKGWVVSVGANGGRGVAWIGPKGAAQVLKGEADPWQRCFARDLEPKGMYTELHIPDDRGKLVLTRTEPGHGVFVGFPVYSTPQYSIMVPEGDTFGFWPGAADIFVTIHDESLPADPDHPDADAELKGKAWFYRADGTFAGWIGAHRIADAPGGKGMIFYQGHGRVVTLGTGRKLEQVEQFMRDDQPAFPWRVFPDLRLGLFLDGKNLTLAAW
jgi:hypothetical protein